MQRFFLAVLAASMLAGCASAPTTYYYTLESVAAPQPLAQLPELSLGLGPIALPDTLDRPQIVTHTAPYSLDQADYHRWGGDLKANLERHLGERLMGLLGTQRVYHHPWPRHRRLDYQVDIDVLRYDGQLGGEVQLIGSWALLDGSGRRELERQAISLHEMAAGPEYQDLAAAMSLLADRLAEQIATVVAGRFSTIRK